MDLPEVRVISLSRKCRKVYIINVNTWNTYGKCSFPQPKLLQNTQGEWRLVCPLKIIRLVLRPGTGLCDLILVLIREVITSTLHKSVHTTCELSFGKTNKEFASTWLCYTHRARYVDLYLDQCNVIGATGVRSSRYA